MDLTCDQLNAVWFLCGYVVCGCTLLFHQYMITMRN